MVIIYALLFRLLKLVGKHIVKIKTESFYYLPLKDLIF